MSPANFRAMGMIGFQRQQPLELGKDSEELVLPLGFLQLRVDFGNFPPQSGGLLD